MKKKDFAKELRQQNENELNKSLSENLKEYFKLRVQYTDGQMKNTAAINTVRKKIATINTIIKEKDNGK